MGKVATTFKIHFDNDKEDNIKDALTKLGAKDIEIEELAFGIKVIKALFIHDDNEGSSDIEEHIKGIDGVSQVDVIDETLI